MDFPVTAQFVSSANAAQLHVEARGGSTEWPASFVSSDEGWVYRVDETEGVTIDPARVQAALDAHEPDPNYGLSDDRKRLQQVVDKAKAIMADPAGSTDWTALERKVILAALVLRAKGG